MMSGWRIYKLLQSLLRMWTIQKPLNNSIFLQGRGASQKQIFFFVCLCWWRVPKKKKNLFRKKPPQFVWSVRLHSKSEFSKEKSGYESCHLADSPLKSPRNPGWLVITWRRWALRAVFSRLCFWAGTQRRSDGLPEPWGIHLSNSCAPSPNHGLWHPSPQHPPQQRQVLVPLVVQSLRPATCCPWQGLCHPVLDVPCSRHADRPQNPPLVETHPAALSLGEGVKETPAPTAAPPLMNIYWNWYI